MSNLLEDIEGAEPIVDDILVWERDAEEHDKHIQQVLERLKEANLKLNPQKYRIRKDAVPYIGHLLTRDGLMPIPGKVHTFFFGFMQYLANSMPNMADVSSTRKRSWVTLGKGTKGNLSEACYSKIKS